ncbi:hypothetical protein N2152v2_001251 [Parachlorella kessleri]
MSSIEDRVSLWTKLPVSHQEDTQVLRYEHSQKYGAHYDSVSAEKSPRIATVLMYLSTPEEGGETTFSLDSKWIDPSLPRKLGPFSDCAEGHVAMKPKKGDALVFWGLKPDGSQDRLSMHTACPVLKGIKWVAIKWIHTEPFREQDLGKRKNDKVVLPEECVDREEACEDWARKGECERNPNFMRGDAFSLGACRAACEVCKVCQPWDLACKNRNRERQGYLLLSDDPNDL